MTPGKALPGKHSVYKALKRRAVLLIGTHFKKSFQKGIIAVSHAP